MRPFESVAQQLIAHGIAIGPPARSLHVAFLGVDGAWDIAIVADNRPLIEGDFGTRALPREQRCFW